MTSVHYTTCDRCGVKDDYTGRVFHLAVQDINSCTIGHLCISCARECMPRTDWTPFDRSA